MGIGPFYLTKFILKIGYQERLLFTVKYKRVILNNFVSSREVFSDGQILKRLITLDKF